jgi:Ni2+-binding GTPase involved in maturation of urease and hydrogenase
MSVQHIKVVKNLLASNDQAAERNGVRLAAAGILAVNVIAAPGAGKTSLIVKTLDALRGQARIGVIEGDIAGSIDTERCWRPARAMPSRSTLAAAATWKPAWCSRRSTISTWSSST